MKSFQLISVASLLAPLVSAHGYVSSAVIGGTTYTLYNPNTDPYMNPQPQRINRRIPGNGPVLDVSLIDVQCNGYTDGGFATAPAPATAPVAAGSEISLQWTQWPESHKGPLITYMAKCPGDCSTFSPGKSAVWFKIHEQGKDANGKWASEPLETNPAALYKFKVPAALAPGNYLIRHEIIALHSAGSYPGAQIYPTCLQVKVTGSGTKTPTSLVSFPGAYTGTTPGILYDLFTSGANNKPYPIPGPTVWTG